MGNGRSFSSVTINREADFLSVVEWNSEYCMCINGDTLHIDQIHRMCSHGVLSIVCLFLFLAELEIVAGEDNRDLTCRVAVDNGKLLHT